MFWCVASIMLALWSAYDFVKVWIFKKKYQKDDPRIYFTATKMIYVFVGVGVFISAICFFATCMYGEYVLMLSSAVCLSCASRGFLHSYYLKTERFIIMNGRIISRKEIEQYGQVRKMTILSVICIFELCTEKYREYIYVKEGFNIKYGEGEGN